MPIVVGEFGGRCVGADEAFQKRLVKYLSSQSIGAFYWSVRPARIRVFSLAST